MSHRKEDPDIMPLIKLVVALGRPLDLGDLALLITLYRKAIGQGRPFTTQDINKVLPRAKHRRPTPANHIN